MEHQELNEIRSQYEADIKLAEAAEKLYDVPEFKEVFVEHLFKDALINLGLKKGHPNAMDEKMQADLDAQITAIGRINASLSFIIQRGYMSKERLEESYENEKAFLAGE